MGRLNSTTIRLSWPDKSLSSNARVHWAAKARATKQARAIAHYTLIESIPRAARADFYQWAAYRLRFQFHPPDRRKRDLHNMPSAMKAVIDGIADGLRVDDSCFDVVFPRRFSEPRRHGQIIVQIIPMEEKERRE